MTDTQTDKSGVHFSGDPAYYGWTHGNTEALFDDQAGAVADFAKAAMTDTTKDTLTLLHAKTCAKIADGYSLGADEVAELLDVIKAQRVENGKLHAVINGACVWTDGEPDRVHRTEWFIAKSIHGDRAVLRALHDEHSYDYETADGTYILAKNIASWMQFPDSNFIPFADRIAALKGPTNG